MRPHPMTGPQPPMPICGGRGTVQAVPIGSDNVGWIVACGATGEAALVDGPEAGPYLDALAARGLRLSALWTTHTHGDHIGLHRDLARRGLLGGLDVMACRERLHEVPGATVGVDEGDTIKLGQLRARVWRLEGHLRGHLGFVVDGEGDSDEPGARGAIFCGDTMFGAGCGYLFDGPAEAMAASLARIASLPPATLLCCAHEYTWDNLRFALWLDPEHKAVRARMVTSHADLRAGKGTLPSTIEIEQATNPFIHLSPPNNMILNDFRNEIGSTDSPVRRFTALRRLKDQKAYQRDVTDEVMAAVVTNSGNSD